MDKECFVSALEKQSDMLFRVAYSLLRNPEDCRDALQETALRAWEKRGRLREERYFATWVTRILINQCHDILRRRRRTVPMADAPEPMADPPDVTLSLALGRLPEKSRLPLMLQYSEGMSYQEIARALGVTEGSVRGRIHRAKEQLRKELEAV